MSVTVRTKGSNSSKIVLEFYIQFEYIVYILIRIIYICYMYIQLGKNEYSQNIKAQTLPMDDNN